MTIVIARIIARYLAGALVAYGLPEHPGARAMEPDLAILIWPLALVALASCAPTGVRACAGWRPVRVADAKADYLAARDPQTLAALSSHHETGQARGCWKQALMNKPAEAGLSKFSDFSAQRFFCAVSLQTCYKGPMRLTGCRCSLPLSGRCRAVHPPDLAVGP